MTLPSLLHSNKELMQQLHSASSNSSAPPAAAAAAASANSWSGAINAEIPESKAASSAVLKCWVPDGVSADDDGVRDEEEEEENGAEDAAAACNDVADVDDDDADDKPSMVTFHFELGRLIAMTRLEMALRYFMGWNMSSAL